MSIIKKLIARDTIVYTGKWKSYDGLVLDGYKQKCIDYSRPYSNWAGTHVGWIENFGALPKEDAKFLQNEQYDQVHPNNVVGVTEDKDKSWGCH